MGKLSVGGLQMDFVILDGVTFSWGAPIGLCNTGWCSFQLGGSNWAL